MTRRNWFATLLAPILARFAPKPTTSFQGIPLHEISAAYDQAMAAADFTIVSFMGAGISDNSVYFINRQEMYKACGMENSRIFNLEKEFPW